MIVILKSFFDGANQADSTQYDVISLASVSGTSEYWRPFERDWKATLKRHHAPWLHTTDAVSLKRQPFTKENGWDEAKRDVFISDCVTVIEKHLLHPKSKREPRGRPGLLAHVVTIVLSDFIRARTANPEVPRDVTVLCATQAVDRAIARGKVIGVHHYYLTFDQNEPFMGHILDRQHNRKARKHLAPVIERISHIGESDMREVPALQMADLFAWCYSHKKRTPRFDWQNRLLSHRKWIDDWYTYDKLIRIIPGVADLVQSWGLPPRKPTR